MGKYEYFYPGGADQYAFYRIPKRLFTDADLKMMSNDSKILYGLFLDRVDLSVKNKWIDKNNRVYIIYTLDQIQESMNVSDKPATKMLRELESTGLIERKRQGQGRPALLYVKNFASRPEIVRAKNRITSDTRLGDTPITDSEILRCNKTDRNNTDYNETDPILSGSDGMGVRKQLTSYFKEKLQYDSLLKEFPRDRETIDGILGIVVDLCASRRRYIRIAGDDKPAAVVQGQMMKLTGDHVRYVLNCLQHGKAEIRNIKQYLAGSLYNAPLTINSYYTAQANYDTDGARDGESGYRDRYYNGAGSGYGDDDPYEYLCANL